MGNVLLCYFFLKTEIPEMVIVEPLRFSLWTSSKYPKQRWEWEATHCPPFQRAHLHPPERGPGLTILCRDPNEDWTVPGDRSSRPGRAALPQELQWEGARVCVGVHTCFRINTWGSAWPWGARSGLHRKTGAPGAAGAKASQTPTLSTCNLLALVLRSLI